MPELPEVEAGRRLAEEHLAGKEIHYVEVTPGGDSLVFCNNTAEAIKDALVHRKIQRCCRRGKYIWFELDRNPYISFHFGMTGAFVVKTGPSVIRRPSYGSIVGKENEWPPFSWKLQFKMDDGTEFAFVNIRRLGRVRFIHNSQQKSFPFSELGFDPLLDKLSVPQFSEKFKGKQCSIKSALLDQTICAGVGNWIADETLYQAGIHPASPCNTIDADGWKIIKDTLERVVSVACRHDADSTFFPSTWLFHYRWATNKSARGAARDSKGNTILFSSIGGRTTAFVPTLQKLYKAKCCNAKNALYQSTAKVKGRLIKSQKDPNINHISGAAAIRKQSKRKQDARAAIFP